MHKDHVTNVEVRDKIKDAIDKQLSMTISPFHCETDGMVISQEPLTWPR